MKTIKYFTATWCGPCQRFKPIMQEVANEGHSVSFIDIDSQDYQPDLYSGISYKDAMGRIHALNESGEILKDVAVFREAYRLVGLGWIYAPTNWPMLGSLIDQVYKIWAYWRLPLTRRPSL